MKLCSVLEYRESHFQIESFWGNMLLHDPLSTIFVTSCSAFSSGFFFLLL
jgi:hypothetical protein